MEQNLFKTNNGMVNIAPIKLSGQYKIVVDINQNLWLDDYSGRRIELNMSELFLPQVANFLKTKTEIDNNQLAFGGFQRSTQKSWHIPFHLEPVMM